MASTNKHVNKLEAEVSKKQERIDDYLATQIYLAHKNLQFYLDEKEKEEQEIADIKKQQEALRNHKQGQLAKVSMYEFVNDWLRPELAWHIFSYVADDPHKKGIKKALTHRATWRHNWGKKMWNGRMCKTGEWKHYRYERHSPMSRYDNRQPYCKLTLYKSVGTLVGSNGAADTHRARLNMRGWLKEYTWGNDVNGMGGNIAKLKNTNPLLKHLWEFHAIKYVGNNGNEKFIITKKEITKLLKEWKVPGRTDITYGVRCSEACGTSFVTDLEHNVERPPESRRRLVGALMKVE
tara:strand:- start:9280 stop:10158 length:879 start_codon:yes stop_codon:yes gene_type:complete